MAELTDHVLEAHWQTTVLDMAERFGWIVAHFRRTRTAAGTVITPVAADGKGFPDLVLARDRVLFVELKKNDGSLSPEQKTWRRRLLAAGAEHHVWRPRDADDVETTLRGIR